MPAPPIRASPLKKPTLGSGGSGVDGVGNGVMVVVVVVVVVAATVLGSALTVVVVVVVVDEEVAGAVLVLTKLVDVVVFGVSRTREVEGVAELMVTGATLGVVRLLVGSCTVVVLVGKVRGLVVVGLGRRVVVVVVLVVEEEVEPTEKSSL